MKPLNAKNEFLAFISKEGKNLQGLSLKEGIELMLSFYEGMRADGCDIDYEGDMLLFQWGVYDWGDGEHFEYDLTRQLAFLEDVEEDGETWEVLVMWQLRLVAKCVPTEEMRLLPRGEKWCPSLKEIDEFRTYINDSKATEIINATPNIEIELVYGQG